MELVKRPTIVKICRYFGYQVYATSIWNHFMGCLCNKYIVGMLLLPLQRFLCLPNQRNASGIFCGFWISRWHGSQLSSLQFCRTIPEALHLLEENMSKVTITTPQNTKISCGHVYKKGITIIFTMHEICFSTSYMYQRIFRQRAVEIMDLKHHQKANWIQQIKNLHFTLFYLYDQICSIRFSIFICGVFEMTTPPKTNEKGTLKTMDWKFKISLLF